MYPNLAPVVQKMDNATHWTNHYPLDSVIGFPNTYPLDSDLSGGYSLRASSPIWASEASLARTRELGASPLARAFRETRFTRPNRRACSQARI